MQISDIASPTDSVSSNLFRLNGSSATISTPCYDFQRPLVDFEEFSQSDLHLPARPLPKKKLTIDIDQINDFEQQQAAPAKQQVGRREEEGRHSLNAIQFLRLREQVEGQRARIDALQRERQYLLKENQQMKAMACKKDQMLQVRQGALEQLSQKLSHIEAEVAQDRFYDQKLREKENRWKQLKKQNEKLATMNRSLQAELRQSQRKIMDLEKDIQNTICTQYQTVLRAKESSIKLKESSLKVLQPYAARDNKENAFGNTVKSLDKKKPSSTQPKKPTKIATSTLNFAKKLQMKTNLL